MLKRQSSGACATALLCCMFTGSSLAQEYPTRPVTLIVPYAAGGSADVLPRIIADHMRTSLGKPVVVTNRTGASGSIGTEALARAAPNGYTFGLGTWSTHVANAAVYALPYDVLKDFEPISLIASSPLLISAKKSMPAKDLRELVSWLKTNPEKATQGTNGAGSVMHLAGVLFQRETATRFQFVPYRGGGPATQALVAGEIDIYLGLPADLIPHARAGSIRVYAAAAKNRLSAAGEIPTVDEMGVPGLYVSAWFGFWAPAGTPRDAIHKLNNSVVAALGDGLVVRRLRTDLVLDISPRDQQTPDALAAYQKSEVEKWWPLIRAANIKAE